MAIEQEIEAEPLARRADELLQRAVIGAIEPLDALDRLGEAELPRIDLLAGRDDARDRAEPDAHPRRAAVDVSRQRVLEHRRVELERLAVGIEIGPRESTPSAAAPPPGLGIENLVDDSYPPSAASVSGSSREAARNSRG